MIFRIVIGAVFLGGSALLATCVSVPQKIPPMQAGSTAEQTLQRPSWGALVRAPECRSHHTYLNDLYQTHASLRPHFLGMWLLCAISSGNASVVTQLTTRMQATSDLPEVWQAVLAWSAWLESPSLQVPRELPEVGAAVLAELAVARVAAPGHLTEAIALYRHYPAWWVWQEEDRARMLVHLDQMQHVEIAQQLVRHGLRDVAWRHLAENWQARGVGAGDVSAWWPEADSVAHLWVADLAFSLRHYDVAETIAAQLVKRGKQVGPALLTWGRALARQGRGAEAARGWLRERDRIRGTEHWLRVTYRLGLLAEDRHDMETAISYFLAAASQPFAHDERDHAGFLAGWRAYQAGDAVRAATIWHDEEARTEEHVARRRLLYWLHKLSEQVSVRDALYDEAPLSFYAWLHGRMAGANVTTPVAWRNFAPVLDISGHERFEDVQTLTDLQMYPVAQWAFSNAVTAARDDGERIALLQMGAQANVADLALSTFWTYYYQQFRADAPQLHRDLWRIVYPRPYEREIAAAAQRFDVDPALLYAIMREESRFQADVISPVGAVGLLQLMPATAQQTAARVRLPYGGTESLVDPAVNIPIAAAYIRQMLDTYDGEMIFAIAAYNAGPHAVNSWRTRFAGLPLDAFVEEIPYVETRRYVVKVIRSYVRYQALYQTKSL